MIDFLTFESINYMGSKRKLLPFLFSRIPTGKDLSFFDGFSGSLRVCGSVKHLYKRVTSCDKQDYSALMGRVLLKSPAPINKVEIISFLNSLDGEEGFISETYGGEVGELNSAIQEDGKTRLFTLSNARKIQAIRSAIETFAGADKDYALYCLIIGAAKVQSSTGHQNGYLKTFAPNSLREMRLTACETNGIYNHELNQSLQGDVLSHIRSEHDIFYFDPPYGTINHNVPVATRYTAFYHFWNTLIKNDNPIIFGKANRRIDSKGVTDEFEINKKDVYLPLLKRLCEESNGRKVFISSSNQSVVSKTDVIDYIGKGVKVYECSHGVNVQGVKTRKSGKFSVLKSPLVEYLYEFQK